MHPSDQTDQRVILEIVLRVVLSVVIVGLIAAFMYIPEMWLTYATRWTLLAIAVALGLGWVLFELLKLGLERLVGFRYLHRGRRTRWALVCLAGGLAVLALGFVVFMLVQRQHHHRILETAGVVCILVGGLLAMVGFLLRALSVFTTISTFGIVLGVASLIVVFGVTSGFEREFEDKVLALNAHLIVQAYGDADFAELEEIETKLRGLPGVVQMAPFLFSAGEVMIGRVGANLKGIDLQRGAEDLRRALERGSVEDLARPARCPLAGTKAGQTTTDVGRDGRAGVLPVRGDRHLPHGLQRIRHPDRVHEHRRRSATGQRAPAGVGRRAAVRGSDAGADGRRGGSAAARQPASPGRLARPERQPVQGAAGAEGRDSPAPGDHRHRRGVQHRLVADHDRSVEDARGRDPEVDGRAGGDGRAHLLDRRDHRGAARDRARHRLRPAGLPARAALRLSARSQGLSDRRASRADPAGRAGRRRARDDADRLGGDDLPVAARERDEARRGPSLHLSGS